MPVAVQRVPNARLLAVLVAAFLGWMFDGLEMGLFPLIARPALQQLQAAHGLVADDRFVGQWMGIVTSAFLIGAALGGVVFGWLGDRIGRVRAMTWSILCYSMFSGLAYFATETWHLGATRFIAALGMGGEWSLGVALVMEVWPDSRRAMLAGVIGAAGNLGFLLIAVIGRVFVVSVDSWRWVALVGALPALLTLVMRLFVPESERWKQATSDAVPPAPVAEIFRPGQRRNTILAALLCGVFLIGTWGSVQWLPLWADQITGGTQPAAKADTQAWTAIGAVVGCLAGAWLGDRVGRRRAYFFLCVLSLVSCAWFFRGVAHYGTWFLSLTFVTGVCTAAFYGWTPLYLPELFPTRARATGQGFAYNAGRVFAALGALQMGALMHYFGGDYAKAGAVITLVYAVGLVLIWFAPETKGRPLPN